MRLRNIFLTILAATALATAANAQEADQTPEPSEATAVSPVTVYGERTREVIAAFVGDVSAAYEREAQLARFARRVCPGVMNLRPDHAQVLIDRIALTAVRVGLDVGAPGCDANVLVIVTDDSDALVPAMMDEFQQVFFYHVQTVERKHQVLEEFARPGRPVRWWHMVSEEPTALGTTGSIFAAKGGAALPNGNCCGAFRTYSGGDPRVNGVNYQTDIFRVLLIVDTSLLGPIRLETLGDYLGMTALARLSPDAPTSGVDTILNLFTAESAGQVPPDGLTAWDLAYLEGLYELSHRTRPGREQQEGITDHMVEAIEAAEAVDGDPSQGASGEAPEGRADRRP